MELLSTAFLAALAAGVAYLVYIVLYIPLEFRRRMASQGVPGTPFVPVAGLMLARNAAHAADDPFRTIRSTTALGRSAVLEIAWQPRLFTSDPEVAQDVLVRRAAAFVKPSAYQRVLGAFLGNGLVTSGGQLHRRQRAIVAPSFHFSNLRAMVELMDVEALLERSWGAAADASPDGEAEVELPDAMSECTLDIIAKAAFGADFSSDPEASAAIREVFGEALEITMWRTFHLIGFIPGLRELPTPGKRKVDASIARLAAESRRLVDGRREGRTRNLLRNASGKDLLDLLLEARDDGGAAMSAEQLIDEMKTFVLAGHETTSRLLAWTLLEMCRRREVWERLAAEVDEHLGADGAPTHEAMRAMPYLDAVVQEGLRLNPPVSMVVREAARDVEVRRSGDGAEPLRLRAGDTVTVAICQVHMDPELWDEPHAFRPERFLSKKRRHPAAFLAFAQGPRSCIGNKFAELEAKAVLCRIVQKYELELVPGQKIVPVPRVTLGFKYGLRAMVRRRKRRG